MPQPITLRTRRNADWLARSAGQVYIETAGHCAALSGAQVSDCPFRFWEARGTSRLFWMTGFREGLYEKRGHAACQAEQHYKSAQSYAGMPNMHRAAIEGIAGWMTSRGRQAKPVSETP